MVMRTIVEKASKSANPITAKPFIKAIITLGTSAIKLKGVRKVRILQKTAFRQ
jgi:hypothetical protein